MHNALNLPEIDQEQALNLIKFNINANKNIFLFGQRGVGKSAIAMQAAQECNYKINYINLSVIERPDLAGYPDLLTSGEIVNFKSPVFLPKLLANQKVDSILLFDEIDKASPEITAPLLEILQFKSINGIPINAAACILTGNLPEEFTYSNQISSALLDRGSKYILQFNFEKWIEWAKLNNIHDLIIAFLRHDPSLMCSKIVDSTYAGPSPRGWTLASEAIIKAKELKITDIETVSQIISGFVGVEVGIKFKIWYEYFKKFDPFIQSLIESGSMNLNWEKLVPAEKLVFVVAACYFAKQKIIFENSKSKSKNKFVYLENLCNFLTSYKVDDEVQIMGFHNAFNVEIITKYGLYNCHPFFQHFKKINENMLKK